MLHPSTKRLIDKLSEMTRKQRVAWSEGENGTITHDTEGYRVVLTPEPHAVLLTDALGKEIESCTPDEFVDETDSAGRPYTAFVADLYREAHRHARGAEKAIHTVLKGLETIESEPDAAPAIAMDPAELVEDPVDETDSLPEAYPEVEGQNDMARAVASMADEVNGGAAGVEADEPEDADPSVVETEAEAETEPGIEPEPEMTSAFHAEDEASETTEPDEPADPSAGIEAEDILSQYASLMPEQHGTGADEAPSAGTDPAEGALWPEDDNAPEPQAEPREAEAESEPEHVQSEPQASGAFGHFFGGSGIGDVSRYTSNTADETPEPAAPVETEAAPEPGIAPSQSESETDEPAPYAPAFTDVGAPAQPVEPVPDMTGEAPAEPEAPRSFSLSGMSSGFGLGSAARSHAQASERTPEPAQNGPSPERVHLVIDGTIDLPDELPPSAFGAGLDTQADSEPVADANQAPFAFSEPEPVAETASEETAEEQAPSQPEEKAFEVPAQTAQPQQADEPAQESPPPAPKVTTRFNPWN
ncbi:hypothetical protein [Hyphomonas sp.]|uniref:hypothetical protein n=1 Tax=Hyphomonas sp. TaxID=87 RepID=UPI003D2E0DD9